VYDLVSRGGVGNHHDSPAQRLGIRVQQRHKEVVTYIARMLPILALSFLVDGLNGSLSGKLKLLSENEFNG